LFQKAKVQKIFLFHHIIIKKDAKKNGIIRAVLCIPFFSTEKHEKSCHKCYSRPQRIDNLRVICSTMRENRATILLPSCYIHKLLKFKCFFFAPRNKVFCAGPQGVLRVGAR